MGDTGSTGATGAQGATGQGFTYRNGYNGGTTYNAYDVVTFGGSSYVALQGSNTETNRIRVLRSGN